jgi:hypothetical protein
VVIKYFQGEEWKETDVTAEVEQVYKRGNTETRTSGCFERSLLTESDGLAPESGRTFSGKDVSQQEEVHV